MSSPRLSPNSRVRIGAWAHIALAVLGASVVARSDASAASSEGSVLAVETSPVGNAPTDGTVSTTGSYSTLAPLELPVPRGDLVVPLSLVYDGSRRLGAAGVGWDIPLSYVEVSSTLSRRKPNGSTTVAQRVLLNIDGNATLMVQTDAPDIYRPFTADAYGELQRVYNAGAYDWHYRAPTGLIYVFTQLGTVDPSDIWDSSRWYLTRIHDTSGNRVEVTYSVIDIVHPDPIVPRLKQVLLDRIEYSHDRLNTCAKHQIRLQYRREADPSVFPPDRPLAIYIDEGHAQGRDRVLSTIEVWDRLDESCSTSSAYLARSYEITYSPDGDTQLPRLSAIDVRGGGSVPTGGKLLPVGRYDYGSAITPTGLRFEASSPVTLPSGPSAIAEGYASLFADGGIQLWRLKGFDDYDGDARPDYSHTNPDFFTSPEVRMFRNRPGGAAPAFTGTLFAVSENAPVGAAEQFTYGQPATTGVFYPTVTATWQAVVDWNGDGRKDLVEAAKGRDLSGNPNPDYWRVRLNFPPLPGTTAIVWQEIYVDVTKLRSEVFARHAMDLPNPLAMGNIPVSDWNPNDYLPISRSQTANALASYNCNSYSFDSVFGVWERGECSTVPEPRRHTSTVTEWELRDVNGDGFPDFILNSQPIALHDVLSTCPSSCPDTTSEVPTGCSGVCIEAHRMMDLRESNEILVFYNPGVALNAGSGAPHVAWLEDATLLRDDPGRCGLERRYQETTTSTAETDHTWVLHCGFMDVNGDGLEDYVTAR